MHIPIKQFSFSTENIIKKTDVQRWSMNMGIDKLSGKLSLMFTVLN